MGFFSFLFGDNKESGGGKRTSKSGTTFRDATKGRVIIERPGGKPAIGHSSKSKGKNK